MQRDAGVGVKGKAVVAASGFTLGAGEGVLFARLGVQENREVPPHRQVALLRHLLGRGPHHHPVAVGVQGAIGHTMLGVKAAQQAVPHCTADEVDLHAVRASQPGAGNKSDQAYFSRMRVERSTSASDSVPLTASMTVQAIMR